MAGPACVTFEITRDFIDEHRALIAVGAACCRRDSPSMHVFDWMAYKLRLKYPPIWKNVQVINWNTQA